MQVALLLFFGFQQVTTPPCDLIQTGEVIFQETFNQSLQGWDANTGSGDTPGTRGWEQILDGGALEGEGFVKTIAIDHGFNNCINKSKFLLSPNINIVGWDNLTVTFFRKFEAPSANFKTDDVRIAFISADERIPLQERLDNGLASAQPVKYYPSKTENGWKLFGSGVNRQNIAEFNGVMRIVLVYSSSSSFCGDLSVDLVTLRGHHQLPPHTLITLPPEIQGPTTVPVGETIPLRAIVDDQMTNQNFFFWRIFDLNLGVEIESFTGSQGAFVFRREGNFLVTCAAFDGDCNMDPTPAQRYINATVEQSVDTEIVEPEGNLARIAKGDSIRFRAEGSPEGNYFYNWTVIHSDVNQETRTFQSQTPTITFPKAGRYIVGVTAQTHDGLVDPTPALFEVNVLPTLVEIYNPIADNPRREISIPLNLRLLFRGRIGDPDQAISEFFWVKNPGNEILCENELDCPIQFRERGEFSVGLVARAGDQLVGTDFIRVLVDPQLRATIVDPPDNIEIPINSSLTLKGNVSGRVASSAEAFWNIGGNLLEGKEITVPGIARPGRYQVQFIARDRASNSVSQATIWIRVYDPNSDVLPQIISPKTDVIVKPEGHVFFDASLRNARTSNRQPYWEVKKVSTQEVVRTSNNSTLGRVTFTEAGVYEISLFMQTVDGNQFLEKRQVTVKTSNPGAFSSNDRRESAAAMSAGDYFAVNLDRDHYYEIQIPNEGLTLSARITTDGPATMLLLDANEGFIGSRVVGAGVHSLQQLDLPRGTYLLVIKPSNSKAKRMVSFSLSLEVLNPSLYFTDIEETENNYTIIGAVNPNGSEASVEFIAYDAGGNILDKVDTTIEAGGVRKYRVLDLFTSVVGQIAWIRTDSTRDLVGYSQVSDVSNKQSYAFSAANKLSSELYAPHIAVDTVNWETRASVVNGVADNTNPFLLSGDEPKELNNKNSYARDAFNFLDKFGGSLPPGVAWGWFAENEGKNSLAGNEVFSKNGEDQQIVALSLVEAPTANPNFVNDGNTFYFTHIARDIVNFWTGIALVNIEDVQQSAIIRAYGPGGVLVGTKTFTLQPSEKHVSLADIFLEGIGSPANVDWVEIEGDPGVVGYEIFGTWNNKQLAGLEAITEGKTEICFPFVDNTSSQWHGFAAVNVSDQATDVAFQMINDSGEVLKTVTKTLPAKAKQIFILADLFDGIPLNAGWVKAMATQPIAGFELFGTDETMSGIIAQ